MSDEQQGIIKVEVEAYIGMSIQTEDGDWIKSGVRLNTHIGPGFASPETLKSVLNYSVLQAYEGCADQTDLLVSKINQKAAESRG